MKDVIASYDKIAAKYETVLGCSYMFLNSEIDAFFSSLPAGSNLLDAGCGPGFESEIANKKGLKVTGLDLSQKMIERFRERVPDANAVHASLEKMPFENEKFDAIFTSCALLHLNRSAGETALRELFRVLKPEGKGFIGTSISKNEVDLHQRPAFTEVGVKELYFFHWAFEDFSKALTEAGFAIESSHAKPIIAGRPTYTYFLVSKSKSRKEEG